MPRPDQPRDRDRDHYEDPAAWHGQPDDYQVQLLQDLHDVLPDDVESILDVGCGDGHLTNSLSPDLRVVGADLSQTALRGVRRDRTRCTVTALPFADDSFDLVMAFDLIEHLDDEHRAAAVAELTRVARRYLLLAVPCLEQLDRNHTRCAECGTVFHVNHHRTSWNERRLSGLVPRPWRAVELRYTGLAPSCPADPTVGLRQAAGLWTEWPHARCPRCGGRGHENDAAELEVVFDDVAAEAWWRRRPSGGPTGADELPDRSELMALFSLVEGPAPRCAPARELLDGDLRTLDFTNPLQRTVNWPAGSPWARYLLHDGAARGERGVARVDPETPTVWLEARIPAVAQVGDTVVVECVRNDTLDGDPPDGEADPRSGPEAGATAPDDAGVRLYAWDPVALSAHLLGRVPADGGTVEIDRAWCATKSGLALQVYLDGDVSLCSLQYRSVDGPTPHPFVPLAPGHNLVTARAPDAPLRSWGLTVPEAGRWPAPTWLERDDLADLEARPPTEAALPAAGWDAVLARILHMRRSSQDEIQALRDLASRTEGARSATESSLAAAHRALDAAHTRIQQLTAQLHELQSNDPSAQVP